MIIINISSSSIVLTYTSLMFINTKLRSSEKCGLITSSIVTSYKQLKQKSTQDYAFSFTMRFETT